MAPSLPLQRNFGLAFATSILVLLPVAPASAAPRAARTVAAATLGAEAPADETSTDETLTPAQQKALVATGRALAAERCQSCHAIGATDRSANPDAPPFRDFATKWPVEDLEESLAEGIVTGHEEMPEFVFSPEEITAFIEFLRSFDAQR